MSLLTLAASVSFLIDHLDIEAGPEAVTEAVTDGESSEIIRSVVYVLWSASVSLAITIISITGLALLNRSLDPPKSLVINSRLIRLAPRVPAVAVILCLPLFSGLRGYVV